MCDLQDMEITEAKSYTLQSELLQEIHEENGIVDIPLTEIHAVK